jgi:(R,R)-butanediol dehydrogenase/meso-butanediol dehydrogenase/diacetyl reductase
MKALRWHGREDLRIDEIHEPAPRPGEVTVEVGFCGICGSDLNEFLVGPGVITTDPHPATGGLAPLTIGHEFAGRIVELGEGVSDAALDDRVVVNPSISCGRCFYCRNGQYIRCSELASIGMHCDGGMARYVSVPASSLHRLPDNIGDDVAATVEPLTVAMRAVQRGGLKSGDTVSIVGAGPIGLMTLLMARAAGAAAVFVVEPSPVRRKVASELGAAGAFDPAHCDVAREIQRSTPGKAGTDLAFECAGAPAALKTAISSTRRGGSIVILGVFKEAAELDLNEVMQCERNLLGSHGASDSLFDPVIQMIADGRLDPAPLITRRISLDDAVEHGFRALATSRDEQIKVLVRPGNGSI